MIYIFAIIYKSQINDCRHVSARLKPQSIDVTSDANTQMCLDAGLPDWCLQKPPFNINSWSLKQNYIQTPKLSTRVYQWVRTSLFFLKRKVSFINQPNLNRHWYVSDITSNNWDTEFCSQVQVKSHAIILIPLVLFGLDMPHELCCSFVHWSLKCDCAHCVAWMCALCLRWRADVEGKKYIYYCMFDAVWTQPLC